MSRSSPSPPYSPLERRRRRVARIALYTSLVVVLVGAGVVYHLVYPHLGDVPEAEWMQTDWSEEPAVRLLQHYLRIDSGGDEGDEYAAALFLAAPLEAAGLDVTVEPLGDPVADRHANLWATLEGTGSDRDGRHGVRPLPREANDGAEAAARPLGSDDRDALILHGHVDTEPVYDREAWSLPPHGGVLQGPWIYGRGVYDMKSVTVAQLTATLTRARSARDRRRPRRALRFLATSGEETGSVLGMRRLVALHPEIFDGAWAMLTEGGVVEATSVADVKYWGTGFGQKRYIELVACAPTAERLERLDRDVAARRPLLLDGLRLTPPVREFLADYWPTRDHAELRAALREPERIVRDAALYHALPGYVKALFRDDVHVFDPRPADEGEGYEARVSVHLLPGSDADEVRRRLLPDWLTAGVEFAVAEPAARIAVSPLDHPAYRGIEELLRAEFPDAAVGPYFVPWSKTDARFSRSAGVPSYGFSPFLILSPDTFSMSSEDERMAVQGFSEGVERYVRLVRRLTRTP